jgi:hypothetical protein
VAKIETKRLNIDSLGMNEINPSAPEFFLNFAHSLRKM